MAFFKSIGIGLFKFLRAYLITLVLGGTLTQITNHFDAFTPGINIGSSIGILIGGAIGFSVLPALIGLFVELVFARKFVGRIYLFISSAVMLIPWLVELFHTS
jgi:hypothetical protein